MREYLEPGGLGFPGWNLIGMLKSRGSTEDLEGAEGAFEGVFGDEEWW